MKVCGLKTRFVSPLAPPLPPDNRKRRGSPSCREESFGEAGAVENHGREEESHAPQAQHSALIQIKPASPQV